jgi:hypothetical protein
MNLSNRETTTKKQSFPEMSYHFIWCPFLPAGPLPTGRQAVPTEGGAGRNKELMLSISTIPQDTCLSTKRYAGAF